MIREPQDAAAAAICWLGRWSVTGRLHGVEAVEVAVSRHPRDCGWCIYPMPELLAWVEGFNEHDIERWTDERGVEQVRYRVSAWFRLQPRSVQREMVDRSLYFEEATVPG